MHMLTSSPLLQHFHTSIFRALKALNTTSLVSGQCYPSADEEEILNQHLESQRLERQGPDSKLMFNLPVSIISISQDFYCNKKKKKHNERKNRILRQKAQTQSKLLRKIRLQKNPPTWGKSTIFIVQLILVIIGTQWTALNHGLLRIAPPSTLHMSAQNSPAPNKQLSLPWRISSLQRRLNFQR